jgi:glyoxylase-like metal-dependent hydrolase (beta-lactamase superfamily II)
VGVALLAKRSRILHTPRVKITKYTGGMVQTNGYIVESDAGAVLIDAPLGILARCEQLGVKPTGLLLTHQHFDHVEDVAAISGAGIPVHAAAHPSPALILDDGARLMGLPITITPYEIDHVVAEGEPFELAGLRFEIFAVPGHSPDSLVFHVALFQKLFAGDTLFAGSIGRTDLPGGDHQLLLRGIREKIFSLPAATEILPGHGPATTIARESATNPYLV